MSDGLAIVDRLELVIKLGGSGSCIAVLIPAHLFPNYQESHLGTSQDPRYNSHGKTSGFESLSDSKLACTASSEIEASLHDPFKFCRRKPHKGQQHQL